MGERREEWYIAYILYLKN